MTKTYIEFQALLDGIESRGRTTEAKVNELRGLIAKREADYDAAVLDGAPTDEIIADINELRADLTKAERDAAVFQKAEGELTAVIKRNERIAGLAQNVMHDNAERIAKLKETFETVHKRLESLKSDLLKTVAQMGAVNAEANALAWEQNQVRKYIPGKENTFFGGLGVDSRGPADIYINAAEIQKSFKEGTK